MECLHIFESDAGTISINQKEGTELGSIAGEVSARRVSEPPLMIRVRRFTYQVAAGIAVTRRRRALGPPAGGRGSFSVVS